MRMAAEVMETWDCGWRVDFVLGKLGNPRQVKAGWCTKRNEVACDREMG